MQREAKEQRICFLLADMQDILKDLAWLEGMIESSPAPAAAHYNSEKRKETAKLDKIKAELIRLKAVQ